MHARPQLAVALTPLLSVGNLEGAMLAFCNAWCVQLRHAYTSAALAGSDKASVFLSCLGPFVTHNLAELFFALHTSTPEVRHSTVCVQVLVQ